MDLLITGANGQLGRALLKEAARRDMSCQGFSHQDLPVEDQDIVRSRLSDIAPKIVIHAGAWTDVDGCERDPERALQINGKGTANIAETCASLGARLLYISTDFVFDGSATAPYGEDADCNPLSAYGRSKHFGEQAVLAHNRPDFHVVRTSWVFGNGGRNFPSAILARARSGEPLRVVDDQTGSPTFTDDLAEALLDLACADFKVGDPKGSDPRSGQAGGIWHAANEGVCTWHRFAAELLAAAGLPMPIARISSAELNRPAPRPTWSVLDCSKLARLRGRPFPPYTDAIRRYLALESS